MAGGEGWGIQVVVLPAVVVPVNTVRGLLERSRGFEVVLFGEGRTGQPARAGKVAIAQKVLSFRQAVLRQGITEGLAKFRPHSIGDSSHDTIGIRGGVALRAAVWEILFNEDVPNATALVEGVELASEYSNNQAAPYIHAVLDDVIQAQSADNPMTSHTEQVEDEDAEDPADPTEDLAEESSDSSDS